ncbi:ATP:cob(I)alamin adenosyltransferase [Thermoproteus tenax]|uniref:Cob(I)alamin adenosyltransferase n=1 Tax=Thermoproteus tenax (strain ATCC 35583 / DSM 2078 / JCM 9277 / NBRC 100435 / Kra 1) TaxID=768679 RepID=G4RKU3_THETK|nr:cob(I)alamin adenosyltransferase [Thermoproteus tenax]CCC82188.1 cob(I)alamin adenosyltransferase [Thermoproteus tenax Kra 1]
MAKPCILVGRCPGDMGDTEVLWFGEAKCVSKASAIVKLFGALEAAQVHVNLAAVKADGRIRRTLWLVFWSLQYAGFYLSTGDHRYLKKAMESLHRATRYAYILASDAPLGWVVCLDEICAYINTARAWVRWTERRLAQVDRGREVIMLLNHIGNILFELMRTRGHLVVDQGRIHRYVPSLGATDSVLNF